MPLLNMISNSTSKNQEQQTWKLEKNNSDLNVKESYKLVIRVYGFKLQSTSPASTHTYQSTPFGHWSGGNSSQCNLLMILPRIRKGEKDCKSSTLIMKNYTEIHMYMHTK